MWQVVFANVLFRVGLFAFIYGFLDGPTHIVPSLSMMLKFSTDVVWPVVLWCSKIDEGAFRCSLYISPKVLDDSPIYLSSQSC